jgi:hypothetical protein
MLRHWRTIIGILVLFQPAWQFIKWALDWAGRFDLIASHLHDFRAQAVLDFISNPPAWSFSPTIGAGLLLIWWDVRPKETKELSFEQRLLIGFYEAVSPSQSEFGAYIFIPIRQRLLHRQQSLLKLQSSRLQNQNWLRL